MSESLKSPSVIELSTVYFCPGPIPHSIALRDCGLVLPGGVPGLTALYGNQSKQEGFMAARDFAEKNRLQFTVIDFLVGLEYKINPGLMKAVEFSQHDFLPFQRLSRTAMDEIADFLVGYAEKKGVRPDLVGAKPNALLIERPDLLGALMSDPEFVHVKVISHQAKPSMSDRVLNVGTVPFCQWDAILEATCRLNPTTRVTLDRPESHDHEEARPRPQPASKSKPKSVPRQR